MNALPGVHKAFVVQPTPADLETDIPLKGGKVSNAKHLNLYHEVEFRYDPYTEAFLGLDVREQFQFGPSKFVALDTLV